MWYLMPLALAVTGACADETATQEPTRPTSIVCDLIPSGVHQDLNSVAFADSDLGVAVGDSGIVLRTRDGGVSWLPVPVSTTARLRQVAFATQTEAFIVGDAATVLHTTDGGSSWRAIEVPEELTGARFSAVSFWSSERGVISASFYPNNSDRGVAFTVNNGVIDWSLQEIEFGIRSSSAIEAPYMVAVLSCREMAVCGSYVGIYDQSNRNVRRIDSSGYDDLSSVDIAIDGSIAVVGANGEVRGGLDAFSSLRRITTASRNYLLDVDIRTRHEGVAVGAFGTILLSTNIVDSWISQSVPTSASLHSVSLSSSYSGCAVGEKGIIVRFYPR